MKDVALDTCVVVDMLRGLSSLGTAVADARRLVIPLMVEAEIRAGLEVSPRGHDERQVFEALLRRDRVEVVMPDRDTASRYAVLYRELRQRGHMIPVNDLWIAALCLQHGLALATNDAHFHVIADLRVAYSQ